MAGGKRSLSIEVETEKHFVQMAEWLAMESLAEVERMTLRRKQQSDVNAEKSGETILDLAMVDQVPGLGGMHLVTFKRRNQSLNMPWHRLRVGSPVLVSPFKNHLARSAQTGVVSYRTFDSIQVALNQVPQEESFRIDLTADEITRQRQLAAITYAKDATGRLGQLRSVLMGLRQPSFIDPLPKVDFHTLLNPSQQDAVRFGLAAQDLAIIHGPPGTGKTTTVVALIVQAIERGDKVLACAPSNTGVDNLLERLVDAGQKVVRIGHPARVTQELREYTLDGLVDQHESMPLAKEMYREAEAILRQAEKWTRSKRPKGERFELRREARQLQKDARHLERFAIRSILDKADVICATTTFNEDILGDRRFDLVVIDEACQSTEPGCWVPLLRGDKLVLAGDHQQLPPTVLSKEAAKAGFAKSLMERQIQQYGDSVTRLLSIQYRMNYKIMDFSSAQFYDSQLIADDTVVDHVLADLPTVEDTEFTRQVVTFIDTAGAGWEEEVEPEGLSKRNPKEAAFILQRVQMLLDAGLPVQDIAVIAPYAAQVRLLRDNFQGQGLEIDTVDGFQGREKEVVLISLVRSNNKSEIGFLADRRRMNVALTRARRKLIVVGDSATLGIDSFYQDFLTYVESIQSYHSVWEEEGMI